VAAAGLLLLGAGLLLASVVFIAVLATLAELADWMRRFRSRAVAVDDTAPADVLVGHHAKEIDHA
jgi:hypothetical protein